MTLAYLMNSYPMTSTTFIRREIDALERRGVQVKRYAVRHWDGDLVEPADFKERERTHYLLTGNAQNLFAAFFLELATNPAGFFRAMGPWASLLQSSRGGFIRHCAYFLQAAYFRRRAEADGVIHVHAHFATNATAVAMLSRLMGGPSYSFTVHGPDELADAPRLSFPAKIEHAAFVAAISDYCKSQLIKFSSTAFADKITIVHCALTLDDFEFSSVPNNHTFVCVGRLCPQKGQTLIPAAVAELTSDFPDINVILIGDGDMRGAVEAEIARCGVADHVQIAGWLPNDDVRAAVKNARVFLLPSFAEGLPVVIMEALALGRPVISTEIAGIPELVDEGCGWIIPPGSHAALVQAMRDALNATTDDLAQKAREGRRRVAKDHDIDKEAATLQALFADV